MEGLWYFCMLQSLHGNCKWVKHWFRLAHSSYGKCPTLSSPGAPWMMLPRRVLSATAKRCYGKVFLVVTKPWAPPRFALDSIRGYVFRHVVLHSPMLWVQVIIAGTLWCFAIAVQRLFQAMFQTHDKESLAVWGKGLGGKRGQWWDLHVVCKRGRSVTDNTNEGSA